VTVRPRSAFEFGRKWLVDRIAQLAARRRGARAAMLVALIAVATTHAFASDEGPASPSIYQYISLNIDATTGRLAPGAMTLPDETAMRRFSRLRWVPGALEGLGTRHMQWDGSAKASQAIEFLEAYAGGDAQAEAALYELARADDVVTYYNDALDLASVRIPDAEPRLHALALRLATESHDRGPVKLGIAMLGSMGEESDLSIIRTLALHDEFGLYAAEAIAELSPDRQDALYQMARKVTGWGRIEAVTLMTATPDPNLRRWLLTEGFRNDVTPQYVAYQCATIANLEGALNGELPPAIDETALLTGVGDLLQSLVKPAPLREPQVYERTPESAIAYLRLVQRQLRSKKSSFSFLLTAQVLSDYAASAQWTDEQKATVTALAAPILQDKGWHKRVVAALGDDRANLAQVELAAHLLRVETFPIHLKRLSRNGALADRWRLAFTAADQRQLKPLVDVAEKTFGTRFAQRAVGPSSTSDDALEAVLEAVAKFPGTGTPIVEASLLDMSRPVRRAAVETLMRWGGPYLRDESTRAALRAAADGEADEALKARMVALLNVGALP
jgi:hypothetical protein